MKNYLKCKSVLLMCESKFINDGTAKSAELEINDSISVEKIKKETANLIVSRTINFTPLVNAYVKVAYSVNLVSDGEIDKEQLKNDLKEEIMILSNVYSRISLLISQITNEGMFGAVITPPMYEGKQVELIDNCK